MDTTTSILLGIIQGLTEFLPVSSSGHLVLFQNLFGFREPELLFDAGLHLGTLFAVCLYFRADLKKMIQETWRFVTDPAQGRTRPGGLAAAPHALLSLWVLVGTVPTALIGLTFRSTFEGFFGSLPVVGAMLLCTGTLLVIPRFLVGRGFGRDRVGLGAALAVGIAQGLAITPGLSRSGTTIVCGLVWGLQREVAARFSFLLAIPAITGALLLQLTDIESGNVGLLPWVSGFLASSLVGLLALKILMGMVRRGNLFYFAPYCWALGLAVLFL